MSGIVGSYFNTRGSGVVAKLGTDGQVFTSTGAGLSQGFEAAAGGGKINQVVFGSLTTRYETSTSDSWVDPGLSAAITPTATDSRIFIMMNLGTIGQGTANSGSIGMRIYRSGSGVTDGEIGIGTASGYSSYSLRGASFGEEWIGTSATYMGYPTGGVSWMDTTHAQTSALTYKLQMINAAATAFTLNGVHATSTAEEYPSTVSTITLWEILA